MSMDFNDADPQGAGSQIVPDGTIAPVVINLRGIKTGKTDSRVQGLDLEITVTAGPYKGRKAWKWAGIKGSDSDGHKMMVNITRSLVRGMLESAYGINPSDDSADAMNGRRLGDWEDLNGVEFLARFGVENGGEFTDQRTGEVKQGKDKNTFSAITPDDPDYNGFKPARPKAKTSGSKPAGNGQARQHATAGADSRPDWAR